MIEELLQAMQALLRREPVGACTEIPEGNHDPLDLPEKRSRG